VHPGVEQRSEDEGAGGRGTATRVVGHVGQQHRRPSTGGSVARDRDGVGERDGVQPVAGSTVPDGGRERSDGVDGDGLVAPIDGDAHGGALHRHVGEREPAEHRHVAQRWFEHRFGHRHHLAQRLVGGRELCDLGQHHRQSLHDDRGAAAPAVTEQVGDEGCRVGDAFADVDVRVGAVADDRVDDLAHRRRHVGVEVEHHGDRGRRSDTASRTARRKVASGSVSSVVRPAPWPNTTSPSSGAAAWIAATTSSTTWRKSSPASGPLAPNSQSGRSTGSIPAATRVRTAGAASQVSASPPGWREASIP
jgi:hypothetical protein